MPGKIEPEGDNDGKDDMFKLAALSIFRKIDKDENGTLDVEEVAKVMTSGKELLVEVATFPFFVQLIDSGTLTKTLASRVASAPKTKSHSGGDELGLNFKAFLDFCLEEKEKYDDEMTQYAKARPYRPGGEDLLERHSKAGWRREDFRLYQDPDAEEKEEGGEGGEGDEGGEGGEGGEQESPLPAISEVEQDGAESRKSSGGESGGNSGDESGKSSGGESGGESIPAPEDQTKAKALAKMPPKPLSKIPPKLKRSRSFLGSSTRDIKTKAAAAGVNFVKPELKRELTFDRRGFPVIAASRIESGLMPPRLPRLPREVCLLCLLFCFFLWKLNMLVAPSAPARPPSATIDPHKGGSSADNRGA